MSDQPVITVEQAKAIQEAIQRASERVKHDMAEWRRKSRVRPETMQEPLGPIRPWDRNPTSRF